jgi:MFS family permease
MNVNSPLRLSISNDAPKEATTTISPTPSSLTSSQSLIEKAAYRKADIRLLLWYSFVYLIMRIHVQNVTNSAIMNLETGHGIKAQLGGLSSEQWAMVISIFYYPYMFLEPPATLLLKRFSPSKWMARIMITWGIISMCQGAAQSYAGLLICRFFLGAAEAGFYPGVLYHLSFWYPSDQMALRFAFFYACGMFSGTIGGLLAYAISFMNGVAGLAGWRWMFILDLLWLVHVFLPAELSRLVEILFRRREESYRCQSAGYSAEF